MRAIPSPSARDCDALLVSCYELGHEPLGVLVPAGVFDRAGYRARVLDVAVEPFDPARVAGAPLVAISAPMHTALRLGVRVAARVREISPETHICFFGLYAELHRAGLVSHVADSCLGPECEADLLALVAAIARQPHTRPRDVRAPGAPRAAAGTRERALDLTPRRGEQDAAGRYVRLAVGDAQHPTGYVATTRGCKHTCRHCPIPAAYEGTFYALPVAGVMADIDAAVALGARHITFADADYLNGPTHALRVARELHTRHPGVTFDYTAKIEHLLRHAAVVDELHALGNLFVVSAVESFNDGVLRRLHKGHTAADALCVIRAFAARGLTLRPSLVPFTPWETRASLASLFEIVAAEGLVDQIDPVQYSIRLLVPSGSLLLRSPDAHTWSGEFDAARFTHRWTHPDPGMDALQERLEALSLEAAREDAPAPDTFRRMAGLVAPGRTMPLAARPRGIPPRLTEDWFC